MNTRETQKARALDLLGKHQSARLRDFMAAGITPATISRMEKAGSIRRIARGVYQQADAAVSEHHMLAVAASLVPHGVVCLVSALVWHDLTDRQPSRVWLAIDRKDRRPSIDWPPLHIVRFPQAARTHHVSTVMIEGVPVRITDAARTVIDLFRYSRTVGEDVALGALKEALRKGSVTPAGIAAMAQDMKLWPRLRPYLEALTIDG